MARLSQSGLPRNDEAWAGSSSRPWRGTGAKAEAEFLANPTRVATAIQQTLYGEGYEGLMQQDASLAQRLGRHLPMDIVKMMPP